MGSSARCCQPLLVGLTGPIGAGKSVVGRVFLVMGIPVYVADDRAKELMLSNGRLRGFLTSVLGEEVYCEGALNRRLLADVLFSNAELRRYIERQIHQAVFEDFRKWMMQQTASPYVVMEAALIFESGADERIPLDFVIFVDAPDEIRWARLRSSRGYCEEEIRRREAAQWLPDVKKKRADFIISNDGKSSIIARIWEIHQILMQKR